MGQVAPPANSKTTASTSGTLAPAQALIDHAVQRAKADKKIVFVHVGGLGNPYSHKFEEMFTSAAVGSIFAANYIVVPLFGMEGEEQNPGVDSVIKTLHLGHAFPAFAFIDADGKEMASSLVMPPGGSSIGFPEAPGEIQAFAKLLKQTAPRMTDADRTKITDYLTKVFAESQPRQRE